MDRAGLIRIVQKMADIFVSHSKQYLYCFPLDQPLAYKTELPPGLRMELISEANVDKIAAWEGWRMARKFRQLLNRGDIGLYIFDENDEVVHYAWCVIKKTARTLSCIQDPIEVGDAYLHRVCIRNDFRFKGVGTQMCAKWIALLQERYRDGEVKRLCGATDVRNIPPQRVLTGLGFIRCQEFHAWRLLGHCFVRWTRDLLLENGDQERRGRLSIRFRIPEIWWDPIFAWIRHR